MKSIKLNQSSLALAKKQLLDKLDNLKLQNNTFSISFDFTEALKAQIKPNTPRPIVYMMANTYLKMLEYVLQCDTEIAWHGTVVRGEGKKKHIFFIKDVYLYPQIVAGATVNTDDDEYTKWSDKQSDEDFNHRRFQGHSHVNMGTTYSGVDDSNQNEFLQDLKDNDYYIFLVTNKRQEHNFRIYDLAQNILFENADIDFRVYLNEKVLLDSVDKEITKNCTKPTYKTHPYHNNYGVPNIYNWDKPHNSPDYGRFKPVSRLSVALSENDLDFIEKYPEYRGEIARLYTPQNGYFHYFMPYKPFHTQSIKRLQKLGYKLFNIEVPDDYLLDFDD